MKSRIYSLLAGLISLSALSAFGQRQELSLSPVGFIHPKDQFIQYERYVDARQSLTVSLSHNGSARGFELLHPRHTERFSYTRGAIGYRYYIPGLGWDEDLTIFGSVRAVVDYSNLQLESDSRYSIPTDSLRATGFSLAPELLFGGKATLFNRITLSGAFGIQYLFKLVPTGQITRNQQYWAKVNSEDNQGWQVNRSYVTDFRRGWYPSLLFTVGVILGKRPQSTTAQ